MQNSEKDEMCSSLVPHMDVVLRESVDAQITSNLMCIQVGGETKLGCVSSRKFSSADGSVCA